MLRALRAEFIKALSLTSTYVYVVLIAGAIALPTFLDWIYSIDQSGNEWWRLVSLLPLAVFIAIFFGASNMGNDQSNRYTAHAFLTLQHRWQLVAAKSLMLIIFTLAATLVGYLFVGVINLLIGNDFPFPDQSIRFWAFLISCPFFAILGQSLAALLNSKIAAIGIAVAWIYIIESFIIYGPFEWGPKVGYYVFPMENWFMITQNYDPTYKTADLPQAFAVFSLWTVGCLILGIIANQRRNVK